VVGSLAVWGVMRTSEQPAETPSESELYASHGHSTIRPSSPWATLPAAWVVVSKLAPLIRPTSWKQSERRRVGPAHSLGRVGSGRSGRGSTWRRWRRPSRPQQDEKTQPTSWHTPTHRPRSTTPHGHPPPPKGGPRARNDYKLPYV